MAACGRGDADAFAQLFDRYRQPIWAFFRRRLRDSSRAQDLAQDLFVAVLRNAKRYRPDAPVRTYLFGIAFRLLAAEKRRLAARAHATTVEPGSSETAQRADAAMWVRKALEELDVRDREIVMLREYEELSYREIAELLNVPINTVRSRLFRARMELRQRLNP